MKRRDLGPVASASVRVLVSCVHVIPLSNYSMTSRHGAINFVSSTDECVLCLLPFWIRHYCYCSELTTACTNILLVCVHTRECKSGRRVFMWPLSHHHRCLLSSSSEFQSLAVFCTLVRRRGIEEPFLLLKRTG